MCTLHSCCQPVAAKGKQLGPLPAQSYLKGSELFLLVGLTAAEQADLTVMSCGIHEVERFGLQWITCSRNFSICTPVGLIPIDLTIVGMSLHVHRKRGQ